MDCTLDELANADVGLEVAAADAAVELLALAAGGVGIVEVARVLHCDRVTLLRLVHAISGGNQSLLNAHGDCCGCELAGVDGCEGLWERGNKSGASEEVQSRHC